MQYDAIVPITPGTYEKCNNIWDMARTKNTGKWLEEIKSGNRLPYACVLQDQFIGEISLVLDTGDPDYTIPRVRAYVSRLVVKKEYRNRGIGGKLTDFICQKAKEMGFSEVSIGVDKDNEAALHLYRKKGFDEILFDGADEQGPYFKLLKRL